MELCRILVVRLNTRIWMHLFAVRQGELGKSEEKKIQVLQLSLKSYFYDAFFQDQMDLFQIDLITVARRQKLQKYETKTLFNWSTLRSSWNHQKRMTRQVGSTVIKWVQGLQQNPDWSQTSVSHVCSSILSCSWVVFLAPLFPPSFGQYLPCCFLLLVPTANSCFASVVCSFCQCLLHDSFGAMQRPWRQKTTDCLGYFLLSHQELILQCGGKGPSQLTSDHSYTC